MLRASVAASRQRFLRLNGPVRPEERGREGEREKEKERRREREEKRERGRRERVCVWGGVSAIHIYLLSVVRISVQYECTNLKNNKHTT